MNFKIVMYDFYKMTKEYKCDTCLFITSDIKSMILHRFICEPTFECEICLSKFKSKHSLRMHIKKSQRNLKSMYILIIKILLFNYQN